MLRSRFWKNFDWILFGLALLLTAVGLIVIYSTSFKALSLASPVDASHQVIFALVGLGVLLVVARFDYRSWTKLTAFLYGFMILSLVAVLLVGREALGATRWIDLGFFQFQPSEVAKLILVIVLAKFFSRHYDRMHNVRYVLISLAYVAVPAILVLVQPDLGTALVFGFIWLVMAIVARVRLLHLGGLAALAVAMMPVLIPLLKPYQRARLEVFLNPTADPLHTGYNVVQSTIAVGSGQLFGRGLDAGSQSQLNFLPSQHTDFIFAVLSEKLGFVGGVLVLLLFLALLFRALVIASRSQDRFGMLLAVGLVAMLVFHIFINIGMNVGLLPVTGIPLPFVSYGGTSLIVTLAAIGLMESVAIRRRKIQFGI
ncbi:MAG TPA: rod shape-determining protein RodA [Candidatus Dormibacteraeota bacterium]|nr:rod shape-determining protein RodA [Candidatus Dormibacteraeota bacterium]